MTALDTEFGCHNADRALHVRAEPRLYLPRWKDKKRRLADSDLDQPTCGDAGEQALARLACTHEEDEGRLVQRHQPGREKLDRRPPVAARHDLGRGPHPAVRDADRVDDRAAYEIPTGIGHAEAPDERL